jgi:hypothetical protein
MSNTGGKGLAQGGNFGRLPTLAAIKHAAWLSALPAQQHAWSQLTGRFLESNTLLASSTFVCDGSSWPGLSVQTWHILSYAYVCMYMYIYEYEYEYMNICICIYIHNTCIHTYIHTYIHTCILWCWQGRGSSHERPSTSSSTTSKRQYIRDSFTPSIQSDAPANTRPPTAHIGATMCSSLSCLPKWLVWFRHLLHLACERACKNSSPGYMPCVMHTLKKSGWSAHRNSLVSHALCVCTFTQKSRRARGWACLPCMWAVERA